MRLAFCQLLSLAVFACQTGNTINCHFPVTLLLKGSFSQQNLGLVVELYERTVPSPILIQEHVQKT